MQPVVRLPTFVRPFILLLWCVRCYAGPNNKSGLATERIVLLIGLMQLTRVASRVVDVVINTSDKSHATARVLTITIQNPARRRTALITEPISGGF